MLCIMPFILWYVYILSGLFFNNIYQQSGDAKKPYLAQYSADVWEDAPVIISWTNMKINIIIKNILKPLNTNFNILITLVVVIVDNIINLILYLVLYNYYKTCIFWNKNAKFACVL